MYYDEKYTYFKLKGKKLLKINTTLLFIVVFVLYALLLIFLGCHGLEDGTLL